MKKIDTNLHKPVTFVNGTKYKLDKAYTFVNGEKKLIWGDSGVQIDYISSTGTLGGGIVFAIGEDWMHASNGNNVYKIDIANLSNPTLIQSVEWGKVFNYSGVLSGNGNSIFHTSKQATNNRLSVDSSGNIVVSQTFTSGGTNNKVDFVDSYVLSITSLTHTVSSTSQTRIYTYGSDYYFNTTKKHTTGTWATNNANSLYYSGTSGSTTTYPRPTTSSAMLYPAIQYDSDTILINLSGAKTNGAGIYKMTYNSLTKIGNNINGLRLVDDNVICRTYYSGTDTYGSIEPNCLSLLDKTSLSTLYTYPASPDTSKKLIFLGKSGNYYYVIEKPNVDTVIGGVKLVILNSADLSVAFERTLPDDPFNENNGKPTFWMNSECIAQITNSGFLAVSTYDSSTLALRVARFSALI